MNLENLTKVAVALFENRKQIEYFLFLDALKTDKNKAIVEAVERGFGILFEADGEEVDAGEVGEVGEGGEPIGSGEGLGQKLNKTVRESIKPYVDFSKQLYPGTIAKFSKDPSGETRKMMDVVKNKKGKVRIKPIDGFNLNLAANYEYSPEGESTAEDIENAKSVMISTALPHIIFRGAQIARTPEYEEAGKDFIVNAIKGLSWETREGQSRDKIVSMPDRLDNFIAAYDPTKKGTFMGWEKLGTQNLYRFMISKAEEIPMASKVWGREKAYKEDDVVNHGKNNWLAIRDVPAGVEPGGEDSGQYWEPKAKKAAKMSMDSPARTGGSEGEDSEVTVGETVATETDTAEETEAKATLSKLMERIPKTPEYDKVRIMLKMKADGDTLEEISQATGMTRGNIHNLFQRTFAMMRGEKSANDVNPSKMAGY
jgi:hypothetical protein